MDAYFPMQLELHLHFFNTSNYDQNSNEKWKVTDLNLLILFFYNVWMPQLQAFFEHELN